MKLAISLVGLFVLGCVATPLAILEENDPILIKGEHILPDRLENDLSEIYEDIIDKSFVRPASTRRAMKSKRRISTNKPSTGVPRKMSEKQTTGGVSETTTPSRPTESTLPTTSASIQEESTPSVESTEAIIEQTTTPFIQSESTEKPKPSIVRVLKGLIKKLQNLHNQNVALWEIVDTIQNRMDHVFKNESNE
ncbi:uncharacterized protein [Clytia hemisphaerica]|uniref:Cnidarian restricted protein n=1 Tax=Clytia hemisphaerica TaxID=252671 RepID=A0A7M5URR4_9CNID